MITESTTTGVQEESAQTQRSVKDAVQELLKYGLLEEARKPNLYRTALTRREDLTRILEPLDLAIRFDEIRGLAFVVVGESFARSTESETSDEIDLWTHPLVRKQRLSLEQSLLIAILRQHFVASEQESGIGSTGAQVSVEDLLPQLQAFLGDLGSDAQEQKRIRNLLEQLKGHGIVSEVDQHDQLFIRPIIAHVANPANLQALLQAFRGMATRNSARAEHE